MKIVFTGGGTAGHVMPNLALLPEVEKIFNQVHYIGSFNGIEKQILSSYKTITYHGVTTVKLVRSLTLKNLSIPFKYFKGVKQAKKILKDINPNVIFSKGGFVALPVVKAAAKLKIPVIGHESDLSIGLANKLMIKSCKTMCFSFEKPSKKYKNGVFTGSPIREILFRPNPVPEITSKLKPNLKTVIVFGGSLGAKAINQAIFNCISQLCQKYNVIHIVGKNNINNKLNISNYIPLEFVNNIQDYFALSDVAVCRAGSNSIFEMLALKKPTLLIPLPLKESRGDQIENAKFFEELKLCKVLQQSNLNTKTLINSIDDLIKNKEYIINNILKQKNIIGNKNILNEIEKCVNTTNK